MARGKNTLTNGSKRRQVSKTRRRILEAARRKGVMTNEQAKKIGKLDQVWYHLSALQKEGFIQHDGYNRWVPVMKRGRPRVYL